MAISYDPAKRDKALEERGLDFADAAGVIDGAVWEFVDDRADYGEERVTTIGSSRADGGLGLDGAGRGPAHYFDAEGE